MKKKMKSILLLSIFFISYEYVHALSKYLPGYRTCKTCRVITVDDEIHWGIENDEWCSK